MLLDIAKKYGFENYVSDLRYGTIRFYSSKRPQGWKSVEYDDDDNLNGIDYPSQHSAVAQQVANQYLNK